LFLDGLGEPYRSESLRLIREHAVHVDAFMSVSSFGTRQMAAYLGIEPSRIHTVPLGINFGDYGEPRDADEDPFTVGYLARVAPEKGLDILSRAYRELASRSGPSASRLWAAGYLAPEHKSYLAGIRKNLKSWGLSGHFKYHGELDRRRKLAFLRSLSVLSVPGSYADPKGLFLLEAMASGIPVVQPRCGAFTELVETTGGGILVESENVGELAEGIMRLWRDPKKRRELGLRGYEGVRRHYSAARMLQSTLAVYQSLMKRENVHSLRESRGKRGA
jgi:glycosyltransferase involved in cell wall biosynthesis